MSSAASNTLEKVASEFESEVTTDLQEGRSEALARITSMRNEAKEGVAKVLETSVKQAESVRRQIVGAAELEVRNGQLRSLETAVNAVFDSAIDDVKGLSGAKYEKAITQLIKEGIDVIGSKAKVHCNAKDKKVVSSAIRKLSSSHAKLSLDDKSVETIGGIVMTTPDGLVKFDNTFEARLERMRAELRKEVADALTSA